MIGFLKTPPGRMGNVLIQYVFLRQLSERIGIDYFHGKLPYAQYFEEFERRNISLKLLLSKKWRVDLEHIEREGADVFIREAAERDREGYTIVLEPPVLGHLFEFKDENPARFLKVRRQYDHEMEPQEGKVLVGLHFRGTDFREWNRMASLPSEYYRDAIDSILKRFNGDSDKLRWYLFTDDNAFLPYCETVRYLQSRGLDFIAGNAGNPVMADFCRLSQCDYIVSSPSTYAVMAAILGKENKKIIHNRKWVAYCVQNGEAFWKEIEDHAVPWYQVIELV